ncbi:MAG: CRTAC1 family protein [Terriglobia bacterium]
MKRDGFRGGGVSRREFLARTAALAGSSALAPRLAAMSPAISVRFKDVARASGIGFLQDSTSSAEKLYLETMGTGLGWIDYNRDGFYDLFLVQSSKTPDYSPPRPLRCALYRNNGDGTFTDVTEKAGVGGSGHYGQGCAVGDYDNDGYPDLYVTGYGRAILYHNNGNGTFDDVTAKAGVADEGGWSTSAAWFDYDRDGYLDLVVCNYIEWTLANNLYCGEHRPGYRSYCHPDNYRGQRIKLYHNNHDGTFADVSLKSGVGVPEAKGMGVVCADFNHDGWIDIAIANDTWPNFLFINKRNGTFDDVSLISGIAASADGKYEAGMGIDADDVDGDGWADVYITHLDFELNRLYHNNHDGTFDDATFSCGIGNSAVSLSGVAAKFMDYDNDGWLDICQVNSAMLENIQLYHSEVRYREPKLMYRNLGHGKFAKVSNLLGPDFMRPTAGRGLAVADYDNDGDLDFAVNNRGDYPQLLRNDGGNANNWLKVFLVGTKSNRDGTGARLTLTSEEFVQVRQATGGGSYMGASDPRIHFGLGSRKNAESLEIQWPCGVAEKYTRLPVNQIVTIKEGEGVIPSRFPQARAPSNSRRL